MPFERGARFGRYVIEALLGKGGMGEVYRARDTLLRRQVALKILQASTEAGGGDTPRSAARILREARVAAAFQHPNAVAIFDIGEHDSRHFLAMELVTGRSLRSLVGSADVPIEQRLRWLADVGRALDAAHRAGIVHLDIKPENVMVSAEGVVKVLDFGIARRFVFDQDPLVTAATATEAQPGFMGTPRYMAPEQVRRRQLDGRTDQFSWGVLAFELLTGFTPWQDRDSLFDLLSAIVQDPPPDLRALHPDVSQAAEDVIRRALAKDPADRFPTMGHLVATLDAALPVLPTGRSTSQPVLVPLEGAPAGSTPDAVAVKSWMDAATVTSSGLQPSGDVALHFPEAAVSKSGPPRSNRPPSVDPPSIGPASSAPPSGLEPPQSNTTGPTEHRTLSRVRQGAKRSWALALLLLGGVLAAVFAFREWLASETDAGSEPSNVPSGSASAAPVPTTLLNLPPPVGCNEAALGEYRAGLQAQHDGNWEEALMRYETAVKADSNCAAAHLRLAINMAAYYTGQRPAETREIYQRAIRLRASLTERDWELLDALGALVRRSPADPQAFTKRMRELAERFPGDAEFVFLSGEYERDKNVAIARAQAALALDPHYSDAWQLIASTHKKEHRLDDARAALDECLRAAPNSVDCVNERVDVDRRGGRCDEMVTDAQLWITRAPKNTNSYLGLARGLAAHGAATDTVEEALRQRWSRMHEADRPPAQALEQALADALAGRFDRAEANARQAIGLLEGEATYEPHVDPTLLLENLALETNQVDKAAAIATDFLGRQAAWSRALWRGHVATKKYHLEPLLLDTQYETRQLTEPQWRQARDAWVESARRTSLFSEETLWAIGTAMPVQTPAQALEALSLMPASLRASHDALGSEILAATALAGRALLLAGKVDEAVPFLRRAVTHCDALEIPFEDTRANLWLGQALEKQGDMAGACKAYQVVQRRWGQAKPPSVTAASAKERIQLLRCN